MRICYVYEGPDQGGYTALVSANRSMGQLTGHGEGSAVFQSPARFFGQVHDTKLCPLLVSLSNIFFLSHLSTIAYFTLSFRSSCRSKRVLCPRPLYKLASSLAACLLAFPVLASPSLLADLCTFYAGLPSHMFCLRSSSWKRIGRLSAESPFVLGDASLILQYIRPALYYKQQREP
jgi:hypothetical protein